MSVALYDSGAKDKKKSEKLSTSILEGTVVNNCDPAMQGKVLVRVPALDQEVWARLSGPGGGSDGGFFYTPNPDTEVLLGFSGNDPSSAFIINGLWNTQDSPPISNGLTDVPTKRVIKTGLKGGFGHMIEFDDGAGMSITILTATQQEIVLDKDKIQISTTGGTVSITLDLASQKVSISAPQIEIGGAQTASIKLSAAKIEIGDAATLNTSVKGTQVMIN
jgi:uncharacterized protein involved in type VI secretion and phage assembly